MKRRLELRNDLNTDYKATVKAAELIETGEFQADQISVIPIGPKKRAFAKEVSSYSLYYSESKRKDCLNIEVNREGFYDMLPEGLFHRPPSGSTGMSEEEMIADVQEKRAEEKDARRFFMPFEAEINHLRVQFELYENRLDKKTSYSDLTRIFASEWKEFELFDKEQGIIWMHLLPIIHQKRNDVKFLGQLLNLLFKIPVNIVYSTPSFKQTTVEEGMQFKLGQGALGIDSIIGSSFDSDEEEVTIHIGPASTSRLVYFMPGTAYAYLINTAVSYLMPVETEIKINLLASEEHKLGTLGAESSNSYLGYTVYL
jgi:hypothetical protein